METAIVSPCEFAYFTHFKWMDSDDVFFLSLYSFPEYNVFRFYLSCSMNQHSLPHNILLYGLPIFGLSSFMLMDTWAAPTLLLLGTCCYQHSRMSFCIDASFHLFWVYSLEWNCWVSWNPCFTLSGATKLISEVTAYSCHLKSKVWVLNFSTCSLVLVIACVVNFSHAQGTWCGDFNLPFPNE